MPTVILLKENDLSKNTPLGGSIDVDRWLPSVKDAQKTGLLPLLGKDLYNKICNDYKNSNLTGEYLELYEDYIKDYVIHYAASLYLSIGAYMISNSGISKLSPDGTESVSKTDIDYMVYHQRNLSNHYERQMLKFLKDSSIPEYTVLCKNKKKNTTLGWYL